VVDVNASTVDRIHRGLISREDALLLRQLAVTSTTQGGGGMHGLCHNHGRVYAGDCIRHNSGQCSLGGHPGQPDEDKAKLTTAERSSFWHRAGVTKISLRRPLESP
jgi:hypothetical protein